MILKNINIKKNKKTNIKHQSIIVMKILKIKIKIIKMENKKTNRNFQ